MRYELSPKSKYYLPKHRFLELYHFCLQYKEWKQEIDALEGLRDHAETLPVQTSNHGDPTASRAIRRAELSKKMELVERTAAETDPVLAKYIFKSVTDENVTFINMSMMDDIPCCANTFTSRKRRFYWLLSQKLKLTGR